MADDITLSTNIGSGSVLATDEITSKHYQIVKVTYGALDSQTLAASGAGAVSAGVPRTTLASDDPAVALLGTIDADTSTVAGAVAAGQMQVDIVADGAGLATAANQLADGHNVTVDNASIVVTATNLDCQSGGADMATAAGQLPDGHNVTVDNASLTVDLGLNNDVTATLDAETTKVIGTVRMASGGVASGSFASGSIASGAVVDLPLPSGAATSVNQLPATSGGISTVYRDEDIDETAVVLKASPGQIYWIHCTNFDATPVYLHFYDVAQGSVTVGTTGELCSFAVPTQGDANGAGFTLHFNNGIEFGTAITVACTTTISGTSGPGTNEVILNVGYA